MILRDPVHGLVAFEGRDETTIEALLATKEVQRLRHIRQLGLTSLVFPGAEHSRFSHAVGAAHVMVRLHRRVRRLESRLPPELRLDDEAVQDSLAAALLHDLGHGPFSHLFEEVMPNARHHEAWTADTIADPATEVHQALEGLSKGMAGRVLELLNGSYRIPYLSTAVSGTWDVDRADYLLRDSHMTGVRYGIYDLDWLLRAFGLVQLGSDLGGRWVLAIEGRKGLPPIEGFFLARHYMYQQVYHHKATRAAETLIRGIFLRLAERVRDGNPPVDTPAAFIAAARGETVSLADYLALDDARLLSCFSSWANGDEPLLAQMCADLQARRLPKTLPLPDRDPGFWDKARALAVDIASRAGHRADLAVRLDVASDTPFSEPENGAGGMFVQIRHQGIQRLGDVSFLLQHLKNKTVGRPRLIFPAALRQDVEKAIAELS